MGIKEERRMGVRGRRINENKGVQEGDKKIGKWRKSWEEEDEERKEKKQTSLMTTNETCDRWSWEAPTTMTYLFICFLFPSFLFMLD